MGHFARVCTQQGMIEPSIYSVQPVRSRQPLARGDPYSYMGSSQGSMGGPRAGWTGGQASTQSEVDKVTYMLFLVR